jgi:AcrR family transcriptional regulator
MIPMVRKKEPLKRLGEPTLTKADWAEAALQLLAERGAGALTVNALADRLGVTKGSFYWHFRSRAELLKAALDRWEQRSTLEPIQALESIPDPRRRLEFLLDAASQPPRSHSLYAALAEAGSDRSVRRALDRVASARVGYLESCYREMGIDHQHARSRAVLAYAAYRGLLQLAREAPSSLPENWSVYPATVREAFVPLAEKSK